MGGNMVREMPTAGGFYDVPDAHSFVIDPASGDVKLCAVGSIAVRIKRADWDNFIRTVNEEHHAREMVSSGVGTGYGDDTTEPGGNTAGNTTAEPAGNPAEPAGNTAGSTAER